MFRMKSTRLLVLSVFFLLAVLLFAAALASRSSASASGAVPVLEGAAGHASVRKYVVAEYQGVVAVFCSDLPGAPIKVTSIKTSVLRSVDRASLKSGIIAESYDEVLMLLEDLGS